MPPGRVALHVAGQSPAADAQAELYAEIERFAAGEIDVPGLADALVGFVRRVADDNPLVGHGMMLTCLPRNAITAGQSEFTMIASGPMDDVATFLSIPPGGLSPVLHGPIAACGGTILSNFEARPL